ncbi:MAG: septum formation initiator family protein [Bacteroidetes bacterium]|nr:septum formation initiator family protein [Bacteroidota bacterium]
MKQLFDRIPDWVKNKFLLSGVAFLVVILFLDRNDLFTQMDRARELNNLEKSKQYYREETSKQKKELEALKNDPAALEKFAREKYLMNKDDEDLFLIPEKKETPAQ